MAGKWKEKLEFKKQWKEVEGSNYIYMYGVEEYGMWKRGEVEEKV